MIALEFGESSGGLETYTSLTGEQTVPDVLVRGSCAKLQGRFSATASFQLFAAVGIIVATVTLLERVVLIIENFYPVD